MKKISLVLLALATLSTTALANDNRDGRGNTDSLGMFTSPTGPTTVFDHVMSIMKKHK